MAREVFVDAGIWIALFNRRDGHYEDARRAWREIVRDRWPTATTNWTLYEALTYQNRRLGRYDLAVEAEDLVNRSTTIVRVEESQPEVRSLEIFHRHADKRWSVVDCANFACIEQRQCDHALSYDGNFRQAQSEFNFQLFEP